MLTKKDLQKINDYLYEIPKTFRSDMRVPARIYVDEKMLDQVFRDKSLEQLVNVTTLPGIVKYAMAMPDVHEGYGFPIGGVAATDFEKGVISPGGIGFDIDCGVRLLTTGVNFEQIKPYLSKLADELNHAIPSGVGSTGRIKLDKGAMDRVLAGGAKQVVSQGYGLPEDLEHCEANGCLKEADPSKVSDHAKTRGRDQLGTLGSGNHFLEIQKVDQIFDEKVAEVFGLKLGEITILIHTGSRGLGHQVCTDWVKIFNQKMSQWGLHLPDRELACAPINSPEGQGYFKAMCAAANFAWANRQIITHLTRQVWQKVLPAELAQKKINLVYDVAHNIGKVEKHIIDLSPSREVGSVPLQRDPRESASTPRESASTPRESASTPRRSALLLLHRKGATRAFPPGHPEIPKVYQSVGQPVLIPGSMGTASYVLVGTEAAKDSFYSVCHGAGRTMSRAAAKKKIWGSDLIKELEKKGIIIKCGSPAGLAEEAPEAYKNVDQVVNVVAQAGLAKKVARLIPLAVIKGE
jgi:tRNA-splicing ligase RtcB